MKKEKKEKNCRLGKVGGEAVLEGVMMRAGNKLSTACRAPDGEIAVIEREYVSLRKRHKFFNIPLLRGVVSFIESMKMSVSTLNISAEIMGVDEEAEETRFEKWLKKTFGKSIFDFVMVIGVILGIALAVGLFFVLPRLAAAGVQSLVRVFAGESFALGLWEPVISSVVRIFLFIAYIALVGLMPDIKRTFQYHGAEHKSIACYEAGEDLTPENAAKYRRFHPRCGTSFMFVMILLGLVVGLAIRSILTYGFGLNFEELTGSALLESLIYAGIGILTLPIIMGLGFEFLMIAGKHDNALTRFLSAPGIWMQRLTTKEPSLDQLECAITALKCALSEEFTDFDATPYIDKGRKIEAQNRGDAPPDDAEGTPADTEGVPAEDGNDPK